MVLKIGDKFRVGVTLYEVIDVKKATFPTSGFMYILKTDSGRTLDYLASERDMFYSFYHGTFIMVSSNKYKKRIATYE